MRKFLLLVTAALAVVRLSAAEYPQQGPDIYDVKADAAALIARALTQAGPEHKNVLLMFGANWCVWCHRLHHTLTTDATVKATLARDFVVVMVDVNTRNGEKRNAAVNEQYGNPIQHGLPVLVVLEAGGHPLTTQETGALEEGAGHSPEKILAFLQQWAPPR
ncbi:MAG: thioredoxin family protein [Opitutaceae bacterium]|nr:thioredoxin family protein [Opitutaceae bacterium]MBP9912702.1 thioredoxin family protein [Opitutaceae bacterium]